MEDNVPVFYLLTVMSKIHVPLLRDFASFHSLSSSDNGWADRHQIPTLKLVSDSISPSEPSLSLLSIIIHSESYVILSNSFQKDVVIQNNRQLPMY